MTFSAPLEYEKPDTYVGFETSIRSQLKCYEPGNCNILGFSREKSRDSFWNTQEWSAYIHHCLYVPMFITAFMRLAHQSVRSFSGTNFHCAMARLVLDSQPTSPSFILSSRGIQRLGPQWTTMVTGEKGGQVKDHRGTTRQ
ncbi:hypothetical protein Dimus_004273 [Dionaea muscipula]